MTDFQLILQSQMDLLTVPLHSRAINELSCGFTQQLFNLVIQQTKQKQDNKDRESLYKYYRIVSSLILYHQYLDTVSKVLRINKVFFI